jgi:hypothetical protein
MQSVTVFIVEYVKISINKLITNLEQIPLNPEISKATLNTWFNISQLKSNLLSHQ